MTKGLAIDGAEVREPVAVAVADGYAGLERAELVLNEAIEKYGDTMAVQVASVYAYRGDADQAFEWLERAYGQRDSGLASVKVDPYLTGLEDDPRFAAVLDKMGLAD